MNDLLYNWMLLYRAIMISDYDNGKDFVVCLYDTENSDVLLGVFNNDKKIARIFGMVEISVASMRSRNILIKKRYYINKFECGTTSSELEYYKIINSEINKKELDYIRRMSL